MITGAQIEVNFSQYLHQPLEGAFSEKSSHSIHTSLGLRVGMVVHSMLVVASQGLEQQID